MINYDFNIYFMKYKPQINQNKISFDFDGTLTDEYDNTPNPDKEEIQEICKYLIQQGKDVCIITKRYSPNSGMGEEIPVFKLAKHLGVDKIYFTDRLFKHVKIAELGIQVHFENTPQEAESIEKYNPNIKVINISDSYWRDLVY